MAIEYNPFLPENRLDPYAHYRAIRDEDPVHYWPMIQGWVLTRYADAVGVLRDPRFSADRNKATLNKSLPPPQVAEELLDSLEAINSKNLLVIDPPDHTRLRNLVNKAFTSRLVEGLRPRVQQIVDELLDAVEEKGEMDVMRDLAYPLPVTVIAEMLGVPVADRELFKRWSDDLLVITEPFAPLETALRSAQEMRRYFEGVFSERRARPRDDLISALVVAEQQGDVLNEQELFAMCLVLLIAGHETTTNPIGNAVLAMLRNPNERRRLQDNLSLMPTAVEEFLRYETIVQFTSRVATEDCELGGKRVREGDFVLPILAAANRDPEQFPEPDRLDLGRRENKHLAFGHGIHFCLGAPLARLEAPLALEGLIRKFPSFDGDSANPDWKPRTFLRGLKSLSLSF